MSRLLHANVGVVDPVFPYVPNDFGFPADGDTTPFLRNLTCRIAGIDRSGYVKADSMSGTLQLEGRDDLSLELIDITDTYRPLLAEPVEITSNANLLFRGTIVDIQERYVIDEAERVRHIDVRCAGAGHALDRRLVFGDIPGNTLYSILIQILQPSGIHSDLWGFYDFAPFPGPQIEAQRANGTTALQYVQRAVNAAGDGWTWWLDWNGNYPQLHVRDLSTNPIDAPWDATDDSGNILAVEGVDYDDSEYANRVYVRMGSEAVSTVTEQFIGGTFAEDIYQLDYVPLEIISITVDDVAQTFGIKSELWDTGDDTSLEWYYQPIDVAEWFANTLWRGPEQSAVTGGAVIEVVYRAQTGSYVRADDATEQAARAALMGFGSGIVEKILEVKDIADSAAAQQYADAMLEKLKTVPTVVRYTTFRHGLKPGQTQTITLAKHDIDGEYNISSVRFREVPSSYEGAAVGIEYAIEATSGTRAVPHPLRLHEDIIDAVRGAQEAARASGGAGGGTGGLGTGSIVWERPRGLVDGTNDTFLSTYIPQLLETENRSIIVVKAGLTMYPFDDTDYTVTVDEGKFVYASGVQPQPGDDHHIIYVKKGGQSIGNPAIGARKFAGGTDIISYGNSATFNLLGDMAMGVWVRFNSDTASDELIFGYGYNSLNPSHPYHMGTAGSSGAWDMRFAHERAGNVYTTFDFDTSLPNDQWFYVGMSRDITFGNVHCYVWNSSGQLVYASQGTILGPPVNNESANTILALGSTGNNDPATWPQQKPFHGICQEHYLWNRTLTKDEHEQAMGGSPPSSGLILSVRLLGNSPEQDESSTGASGTVTGTTVVQGRI